MGLSTEQVNRLLGEALKRGVKEVRLVPGKRIGWGRGGVESEGGGAQSATAVEEIVEALLTGDARMDLALGRAVWAVDVPGIGGVSVVAELKNGVTHAVLMLDDSDEDSRESSLPAVLGGFAALDAADVLELPPTAHVSQRMPAVGRVEPAVAQRPAAAPVSTPIRSERGGLNPAQRDALARAEQQAVQRRASGQHAAVAAQPAPAARRPESSTSTSTQSLRSPVQAAPAQAAPAQATPGREINQLLAATVQARGSDLHLSSGVPPMIRIDGEMRPLTTRGGLPSEVIHQMIMPILPERTRAEFREKRDADFAYELEGYGRFRGNLFVDRNGIGAVFRAIPSQIVPVDKLGFPNEVLRLCQLPKGLVLVTGPTGSGKSTTLASLIDYINRTRGGHIITVEDPVEFVFENKKCLVNQREVGTHTDSFRGALRAALREDPDVLLVGEMRDLETIEIALEMAETGHLVFATLHTTSAPSAVDRIVDQFPADRQSQIRVMLAESLKGVIAQMLCKKLGGGRVAAFEILFGVPAVAHLIREKKVYQLPSVMQTGSKLGMRLMNDSLLELVTKGLVAPDEALSKAHDRAGLVAALKEAQISV